MASVPPALKSATFAAVEAERLRVYIDELTREIDRRQGNGQDPCALLPVGMTMPTVPAILVADLPLIQLVARQAGLSPHVEEVLEREFLAIRDLHRRPRGFAAADQSGRD